MSKSKRCGECRFRGDGFDLVGCDYATITGKTRHAQPPEKCTYFVPGPRMSKAEYRKMREQVMKRKRAPGAGAKEKHDWDKARELYEKGKNDGEIARALGVRPQVVCAWRVRNQLKANTTKGGRRKKQ